MSTVSTENDRLLRPAVVAERLQVSPRQVYALATEGVLRSVKIGRSVRIWESSVEEILAAAGGCAFKARKSPRASKRRAC